MGNKTVAEERKGVEGKKIENSDNETLKQPQSNIPKQLATQEKTLSKENNIVASDIGSNVRNEETERIEIENRDIRQKTSGHNEIEDDFVIVNPDDQISDCEIVDRNEFISDEMSIPPQNTENATNEKTKE